MLLSHQNGKLPQDFHAQTLRPCEIVCRQQLEQRRRSFSPWIINWIKISLERVWKKKRKEKKLLLYFCLSGCVNTCICSWCVIMLQCKIQSDFMGNDGQIARVIKMQMLFFFSSSSSLASIHCWFTLWGQQQARNGNCAEYIVTNAQTV